MNLASLPRGLESAQTAALYRRIGFVVQGRLRAAAGALEMISFVHSGQSV